MELTHEELEQLEQKYIRRAMFLYFWNIVDDNQQPDDAEVTISEAVALFEDMPDKSSDYGKLWVYEPFEHWESGDLWEEIHNTAKWFMTFNQPTVEAA